MPYSIIHDDKPVFITNIVPLVENVGMIRVIVEGAVKDICLKGDAEKLRG